MKSYRQVNCDCCWGFVFCFSFGDDLAGYDEDDIEELDVSFVLTVPLEESETGGFGAESGTGGSGLRLDPMPLLKLDWDKLSRSDDRWDTEQESFTDSESELPLRKSPHSIGSGIEPEIL